MIQSNSKKFIIGLSLLISIQTFSQTIDYSLIPYRVGNKWGFSDINKSIIINPKYDNVQWFSEGLAAVKIGGKWGYINKENKLIIPIKYTVAKSFRKGYIPIQNKNGGDTILFAGASTLENEYENCINNKGIILPKCPAIAENTIISNNVPIESISKQKIYSVINADGLYDKIIDDYKINGNEETYYIAEKAGLYGVFNTKFQMLVPYKYNLIKQIQTNGNIFLQTQLLKQTGLLNADGSENILPIYYKLDFITSKNNYYYTILQSDGKYCVKDLKTNNTILENYASINYDENGMFILIDNNQLVSLYNPTTKVYSTKYLELNNENKGSGFYKIETANNKIGYVNTLGKEFFEN